VFVVVRDEARAHSFMYCLYMYARAFPKFEDKFEETLFEESR
jgi:hypothetical protein